MPTDFENEVYELCKRVPKGKVTTYKAIAHAMGTGAYRAVGGALKRNPHAPKVPCHRVVASDLSIGGFSGARSGAPIAKKIALLASEGVVVEENKIDKKFLHEF